LTSQGHGETAAALYEYYNNNNNNYNNNYTTTAAAATTTMSMREHSIDISGSRRNCGCIVQILQQQQQLD